MAELRHHPKYRVKIREREASGAGGQGQANDPVTLIVL